MKTLLGLILCTSLSLGQGGAGAGSSAASADPTPPARASEPGAKNVKAGESATAGGTSVTNTLASGSSVVTLTNSGDVRCQAGTRAVIDTTEPDSVQVGSNSAVAVNGYASPIRITGPGSTVYAHNTHGGANMVVRVEYAGKKESYSIPPGGSRTINS